MTQLLRRESRLGEYDLFGRFDQLLHMFPFPRHVTFTGWEALPEDMIRVDEYHENGDLVIRAELPGIDPETDVDVSVVDHHLRIAAERHDEEELEDKGYIHNEIRTGSFERILPLPTGVTEAGVTATYKDGILEIRIPAPPVPETRQVPVKRS